MTAVTRAESALARLDQAARQVPAPGLLRQPALRREAQSTSALEGTFAPPEEVLESDIDDRARCGLGQLDPILRSRCRGLSGGNSREGRRSALLAG